MECLNYDQVRFLLDKHGFNPESDLRYRAHKSLANTLDSRDWELTMETDDMYNYVYIYTYTFDDIINFIRCNSRRTGRPCKCVLVIDTDKCTLSFQMSNYSTSVTSNTPLKAAYKLLVFLLKNGVMVVE